jgi:protein-S-isoprenylcysteine O-methyltransferase Ste14
MTAELAPGPAWRWDNVPIPEAHLVALAGAALAHVVAPLSLPVGRRTAAAAGVALVAGGVGLGAWAVASASAAGVAVDQPARLVRTGAYAVSRNPMYLAWSITHLGLALTMRSAWLMVGAALATAAVDREVSEEEAALDVAFGDEFEDYRATTPRYLR